MIFPAPLPSGGRIGICAPSGPVKPERLTQAVAHLESLGYEVVTAPSAFSSYGFRAAPDETRARELEEMFIRDDIQAILCTRGGAGASRLLEILDISRIVQHPKAFLGFSDVTALQWCLFARHQFISFSGPLAVEFDGAVTDRTQRQALRLLSRTTNDLLADFSRDDIRILCGSGSLRAPLMPGNLTMITTLLGTPYLPDLAGKILFVEDVNEPLYRIDRMLFHLRNAGILSRLAGLITGDLGASTEEEKKALSQSLQDATRGTDYPVITGMPYGHGSERMTLPVGAVVDLQLDSFQFTYRSSEPA